VHLLQHGVSFLNIFLHLHYFRNYCSHVLDVGVYKGMLEKWGKDFMKHTVISGASAGTIIAVGIVLLKSPEYIGELYCETALNAKYGIFYKGIELLEEHCIDKLLEDPNAYKLLENRCFIGTTGFFSNHRWSSKWKDNKELKQCLQASLHIPFLCKRVGPINGVEVVDGKQELMHIY
jgi:hypothetical protein